MAKTEKQLAKIVMDCYREMFKQSTPSADFDELLDKAELNEFGQKVIDFMSYEIEEDKFEEILTSTIKRNKLVEYEAKRVSVNVYLGCSPKTKKK
jgi:hypothetical protein